MMRDWAKLYRRLAEDQRGHCLRCLNETGLQFSTLSGLAVLSRTEERDIILLCPKCRSEHETGKHQKRKK